MSRLIFFSSSSDIVRLGNATDFPRGMVILIAEMASSELVPPRRLLLADEESTGGGGMPSICCVNVADWRMALS